MLSGREYFYDRFADRVREVAQRQVILDLGTPHAFRKDLAPFRHLFEGRTYIAMDYKARAVFGPDNCHVNGDLLALPFRDGCADAVVCNHVLEHVTDPHRAVQEMYRTLRPGGVFLGVIPFIHPYHSGGDAYGDYFRFTRDGARFLFRSFSRSEVEPCGRMLHALRYGYTRGPVRALFDLPPIRKLFDVLDQRIGRGGSTLAWMVFAEK